jgi:hypothetical protein
MIYARKLKKKCMVRGCSNIESFALSRSGSEIGNVFICASCMAEGLSNVDECRREFDEREAKKLLSPSEPAPLFYHPPVINVIPVMEEKEPCEESTAAEKDIKVESVDEVVDEASEEVQEEVPEEVQEEQKKDTSKFICVECGKEFDTLKGLNMHAKVHVKE